jgi:hypothetical protein
VGRKVPIYVCRQEGDIVLNLIRDINIIIINNPTPEAPDISTKGAY